MLNNTDNQHQIRIVISHVPRLDSKRIQTTNQCASQIQQFRQLNTVVPALQLLDQDQLMKSMNKLMSQVIENSVQALKSALEISATTRRMQNTDNARAIASYVAQLRLTFDELKETASELTNLENACSDRLSHLIRAELYEHSASFTQFFWREMAGRIDEVVRESIRNNKWIMRTLKAAKIEEIVQRGLPPGTQEFAVVLGSFIRALK